MALREKNPNIRKTLGQSESSDGSAWKVSKSKGIGTKASFPIVSVGRPSSSKKENVPPTVGKFDIFQDKAVSSPKKDTSIDEGKISSFLTAKWEKESSPESTRVLKGPPAIQRSHLHDTHSPISKVPTKHAWNKSSWGDKGASQPGFNDRPATTSKNAGFMGKSDGRFVVSQGTKTKSFRTNEYEKNDFASGRIQLDCLGKARKGGGGLLGSNGNNHIRASTSGILSGIQRQITSRTDSNMSFSAVARQNMNSKEAQSKARPWLGAPSDTVHKFHDTSDILASSDKQRQPRAYNTQSIKMLTSSKDHDAPERAEYLLRQMLCDFHEGLSETPPDGGCFNSVVHAYACRGNATKAEAILSLMQWHGTVAIDQRIFTSVMYAWQRSDRKYEAPDACEQLLRQMHQLHDSGVAPECAPDTYAYTCCLHCWANSERPDAPQRSEALFRSMLDRFRGGEESLKPDTICFSNLINVMINGKHFEDAERMLWEMISMYSSGLESAKPTVRSFNTIIAVFSDRGMPERVQAILDRWMNLISDGKVNSQPDNYTYSLLLKSWTKSKQRDAIDGLLKAFKWIQDMTGEPPHIIQYATTCNALMKANRVEKTFSLLQELVDVYHRTGNDKYRPDNRLFDSILSSLFRSRIRGAGRYAEVLLRNMHACDIQANFWTYTQCIYSYCNDGAPSDADRILRDMLKCARKGLLDRSPDIKVFKATTQAWRCSHDYNKLIHIRKLQDLAQSCGIRL